MKCVKGLLSVLLGTMLISTVAYADVPNKVAVIGDKAYDLDYVNDPKNVDEIRKLLSEGKPVMVKVRDQWYSNNGEKKEEKNAPFKMSYKNSEGAVKEITTAYYEKQSSIIVGIESSKEIRIMFNDEMDKNLITKESLKLNGELLGEKDEIIIDEDNKVVTIKFNEDIKLENDVEIFIGNDTDKYESIEKNIKIIKNQEDLKGIEAKFYDIAILGDDISLDLSDVEGNVFVSGNNIEITKLKNENLQVSEKSEKIVVSESKIDNINVSDEDDVQIKDSEVAKVNKEDKKEENKTEDQDDETSYISQWINASVESFEVKTSDEIKLVFKGEFDPINNEQVINNFKILQDGKEFSVDGIFSFGKEVYFLIDSGIEKVNGEWISKNKMVPEKQVTLKYDSDKKTGLTIDSKYVISFEAKSDIVANFQSAEEAVIKVEEGKDFNGIIDNENKNIKIYEDMTDNQLRETLFSTAFGYLRVEENSGSRVILLVGADGSINEYAIDRRFKAESIIMDSEVVLEEGEEKTLEAKVVPENAENRELTWTTSNDEVVAVDQDGKIKGLKEGVATVTAQTVNGVKSQCKVIVGKPNVTVEKIEFLDFQTMIVTFSEEVKSALPLNSDTQMNSLFSVSIDNKVVDLFYGKLYGKRLLISIDDTISVFDDKFVRADFFKTGSKVKVRYFGGEDGLLIGGNDIESFEQETIVSEKFSSLEGKKLSIKNEEFPGEISGDQIILFQEWHSDFELLFNSIEAPVNSFIQRSFEFPNYLFLGGLDGSLKGYEIVERVQDIIFHGDDSRVIKIGDEIEIDITNYSGMKLSVENEDENIINARLNESKVSIVALNEGVSKIKLIGEMVRSDGTTIPNKSITVIKEIVVIPVEVDNVVIPDEITIIQDRNYELEALIYPKNATHKELTWHSLNEEVAVVDKDGVVTAIAKGETEIIAESNNGITAICKVKVIDKVLYLDVSVNGKEVQITLDDIGENEDMTLLQIENVTTGNLEVFNKYDLVEGSNAITFQLEKGRYRGYVRIKGREKYFVKEFNID